jgi:hypothetical protein
MMEIPAGTEVYIGPPAKPIPKQISDAIGAGLSQIPGIAEAHLPMVFAPGHIDPPAQVLVVVLKGNTGSAQARIADVLAAVLPENSHMDVMEKHSGDLLLHTIRLTGTQLSLSREPM